MSAGREMSSVIALADVRGTKDAIAQLTSSARQRARESAANNKPLAEQYYLGQVHAYELAARLRDQIKDPELAAEVAAVEESGLPAAESRRRVLERVR